MATQLPPPPPPQWVLDLTSTSNPSKPKPNSIPDPPGFSTSKQSKSSKAITPRKQPSASEMDTLKLKKAWELALAPAKQLPMNAIGMYMSGNSLQIFSIMMVFMLFKGPITAMFNIQVTFQRLETESNKSQMVLVKAAFVGCNLLALALGIWKVNGMGLLPYVYVLHINNVIEMELLTYVIGRRDRIGWLGRRRGSRWRGRIMCLRDRHKPICTDVIIYQPLSMVEAVLTRAPTGIPERPTQCPLFVRSTH